MMSLLAHNPIVSWRIPVIVSFIPTKSFLLFSSQILVQSGVYILVFTETSLLKVVNVCFVEKLTFNCIVLFCFFLIWHYDYFFLHILFCLEIWNNTFSRFPTYLESSSPSLSWLFPLLNSSLLAFSSFQHPPSCILMIHSSWWKHLFLWLHSWIICSRDSNFLIYWEFCSAIIFTHFIL